MAINNPLLKDEIYNKYLKEILNIKFTVREIDVITCIIQNRGDKKIASMLSVAYRTVGTHVRNIMGKIGCNSKESIIDFFEKNDKIQHLREYYFYLVTLSSFEKRLKKIALLINKSVINCSFSLDKISDDDLKIFNQLRIHLELSNIILFDAQSKDLPKPVFNLIIINSESVAIGNLSADHNIILTFGPQKILGDGKQPFINFTSEADYYISTFKLIKKVSYKDSLESIIQEFIEEYEGLQKLILGVVNLDTEKKIGKLKNYSKHNRIISVCICISILLLILTVYINLKKIFNKHDEQLPYKKSLKLTDEIKQSLPNITHIKNNITALPSLSNTYTYSKNDFFIKQRGVFEKINKILDNSGYIVIAGAPGIGKSTCASEYVRFLTQYDKAIITRSISATSNCNIFSEYLKIASEYDEVNLDNLSKNIIIQKVYNRLRNVDKVIFVFDNVEDYKDIEEYVKNIPGNVKVIITSRNNILPSNLNDEYKINLEPFNVADSFDYLKSALATRVKARQVSESKLKELAYELGGNAGCMVYKLVAAAAWLKNEQLASIDDYINRHNTGSDDELEAALLFDLIKSSKILQDIMEYCAYLNPDFISVKFLSKIFNLNLEELNKHITKLQNLSLVELVRRPKDNGIKLHRLTQEIIIKNVEKRETGTKVLKRNISTQILVKLISNLDELMPIITAFKNEDRDTADSFYGSVTNVLEFLKSNKKLYLLLDKYEKLKVANLYNKLGLYHQYVTYECPVSIESFKLAKEIYAELNEKYKVAEMLVNQGWSYFDIRKLNESLECFEEALRLFTEDEVHLIKADAMSGKAIIYDKKALDSLKFHIGAYEMYKKIYQGSNNTKVATALHNIAWFYREDKNNKNLHKALDYFKEAYAIRKKLNLSKYHPDITASQNCIGTTYALLGGENNLKKALEYQENVLTLRMELSQGLPNQEVINSYFRLGETHASLKNHAKAIDYFEKAKTATYEIRNTYDSGPMIGVFKMIAEIYERDGDLVLAADYYKRGYSIIKRYKYPSDHPYMIHPNAQKIIEKTKFYDNEFINSHEIRLNIAKYGGMREEVYNIKLKIKKLLEKIYILSKKGQWESGFIGKGVKEYITDKELKTYLGMDKKDLNVQSQINIARFLCFEAINLGIMSVKENVRNLNCLINFLKTYKNIAQKIADTHPEYFVDGALLIVALQNHFITLESAINAISHNELQKWQESYF